MTIHFNLNREPSKSAIVDVFFISTLALLVLYFPFWFVVVCWCGSVIFSISTTRSNCQFIYILGIILCFIFSLISYSIEDVSDFNNYRLIIQQVIEHGYEFTTRGGEFGFYVLIDIFSKLVGPHERVIHFSLLVFTNIILYTALYRINKKNCLLVFITAQFFYLLMVTPFLSRQLLSFAIILLSISTQRYRFILYFCAFFIHFSALILILILATPSRFLQSIKFLLFLLVAALSLSFIIRVEVFSFLVDGGFVPSFIAPKVMFYLRLFDESKFDMIGMITALWVVMLSFRCRSLSMDTRYQKVINIYCVSAFLIIACINVPILPTRIGFPVYYCLPLVFILLPIRFFRLLNIDTIVVLIPFALIVMLSGYRIYINDFSTPWLLLANKELMMASVFDYLKHFI